MSLSFLIKICFNWYTSLNMGEIRVKCQIHVLAVTPQCPLGLGGTCTPMPLSLTSVRYAPVPNVRLNFLLLHVDLNLKINAHSVNYTVLISDGFWSGWYHKLLFSARILHQLYPGYRFHVKSPYFIARKVCVSHRQREQH